jgi:hypothetical protein
MPFSHHPEIALVRESACVLYEPDSGQIRHIHFTHVLEGGHNPTDAEAESMAHASLERRRKPHAHLQTLHVEADSISPSRRYRVDAVGKTLVEESQP